MAAAIRRRLRHPLRRSPSAGPSPSSYGNRRNITLSTKPLSTFAPVADEIDDESDLAAMRA